MLKNFKGTGLHFYLLLFHCGNSSCAFRGVAGEAVQAAVLCEVTELVAVSSSPTLLTWGTISAQ